MNTIMLSCKEATYLKSVKPDKGISTMKNIQLNMHFAACHHCRKYAKDMDFIEHSLHGTSDLDENIKFSPEKINELKVSVANALK